MLKNTKDDETQNHTIDIDAPTEAYTLPIPLWWNQKIKHRELQKSIGKVIESRKAHILVIILTLIDLCVVLTELVLISFYPDPETRPEAVHTAEEALSWTSVTILSIFGLEQLLKLIVFGLKYFFWNLWHLLDATIIFTSLILECILRGAAQETVSLLVIFRLWRLVRVMHGVAEEMSLEMERKLEKHHQNEEMLEKELNEEKEKVRLLEEKLNALHS